MNETLDPSEWLHASYHKVYPFQMKRIREYNGKYYAINPENIFDLLYTEGILNHAALSSAEFFHTLNSVATNKTGYAKMMNVLENQGVSFGGDKIAGFCPNTLVLIISKNMTPWQYAMINRICTQQIHMADMQWMIALKHRISEAFDELGEAIEISVDILKARLDTHR